MKNESELDTFFKAFHWIAISCAFGMFCGYIDGKGDVQDKLDSAYLLVSDSCKAELEDANDLR